jgi:hypothetical protein
MESIYRRIDKAIPALKSRHLRWVLSCRDSLNVLGIVFRMGIQPFLRTERSKCVISPNPLRPPASPPEPLVLKLEPVGDLPDR